MSASVQMRFIGATFRSSPCTTQEFLLSLGITMGTQIWALREELHPSPPVSPLLLPTSHFGRALREQERGIFIAHAALCILSLAFVFPRCTCVYPQPFLQAEMLIWRPAWKV